MMRNPFLAGLGLGLIAAVVFASASTGPLLVRFLLFFITPLPIALAGLGWGWRTSALAGAAGTGLVAIAAGGPVALAFASSQVAPVVVLVYLALLNRAGPADISGVATVEWYPPGRLVLWAALMAALLSIVSLLLLGGDLEELRKALGEFLDKTVKASLPEMPGSPPLDESDLKSLTDIAMAMAPAASAMSWMGSLVFNLWLGARVTLASGQLVRPWPDLAAIEYPRGMALAFAGALLASMAHGYVGLTATSFAGTLFVAYLLLGLAIIHYTTRGLAWRPFALWGLYAALVLVNVWIAILVAVLGLSETVLSLRRRYSSSGHPPT